MKFRQKETPKKFRHVMPLKNHEFCYNENSINGYYDLQDAEVEGAYQNAKRHILIFGSDNKAEVY